MRTKIVAFYTTGGNYEAEAFRFKRSLSKACIPERDIFIQPYLPQNDWNKATAIKPEFIMGCRHAFAEQGILYIDVDAVVHADPRQYFESLQEAFDFAAYFNPEGRFLSGTLWFNDTIPARALLHAWLQRNLDKQAIGDYAGGGQRNLWEILNENEIHNLRIHKLPGRYCWAFRRPEWYGDEPRIIEHLLASRENRDESAGQIDPIRQQRIAELAEKGF